ncbi:MAG: glycosyltransferase family 2 protein [Myxococcota bacterium]
MSEIIAAADPPAGDSLVKVDVYRACAVVPTYNNPMTIGRVARALREYVEAVFIVDDGGDAEAQAALGAIEGEDGIFVRRRGQNGGKGAAVKDGLRWAFAEGYTHALQVDADGQHDLADAPRLLEASRRRPEALVLAQPVFDESAPRARRWGRKISIFWVWLETLGKPGHIADPLCGFRVYPLAEAVAAGATGDRMDFDPEIAVRLVWRRLPVINLTTSVRYVPEEEGGISHYRAFWDNVAISLLHTKLCILRFTGLWRWF